MDSLNSARPYTPKPSQAPSRVAKSEEPRETVSVTSRECTQAAEANNRFSLDLYRRLLASQPEGNGFLAPTTATGALAMLSLGADEKTAEGIQTALSQELSGERMPLAVAELNRTCAQGSQGVEISTSNRLFGSVHDPFHPDFVDRCQQQFQAAPESLDFAADPGGARARINQAIAGDTAGAIPEFLTPNDVKPSTSNVLTSAIHFKGQWEVPFEEKKTTPETFQQPGHPDKAVPTMHKTEQMIYAEMKLDGQEASRGEQGDFKMVLLPYQDERYYMAAFLPEQVDGLPQLEAALTPELLNQSITASLSHPLTKVDLSLPKFSLESRYECQDELAAMGLPIAGDYSPMMADNRGKDSLQLDKVIQATALEVNEQGTVFAGTTGVSTTRSLAQEFKADHPFMFAVIDTEAVPDQPVILGIGRVTDPSLK